MKKLTTIIVPLLMFSSCFAGNEGIFHTLENEQEEVDINNLSNTITVEDVERYSDYFFLASLNPKTKSATEGSKWQDWNISTIDADASRITSIELLPGTPDTLYVVLETNDGNKIYQTTADLSVSSIEDSAIWTEVSTDNILTDPEDSEVIQGDPYTLVAKKDGSGTTVSLILNYRFDTDTEDPTLPGFWPLEYNGTSFTELSIEALDTLTESDVVQAFTYLPTKEVSETSSSLGGPILQAATDGTRNILITSALFLVETGSATQTYRIFSGTAATDNSDPPVNINDNHLIPGSTVEAFSDNPGNFGGVAFDANITSTASPSGTWFVNDSDGYVYQGLDYNSGTATSFTRVNDGDPLRNLSDFTVNLGAMVSYTRSGLTNNFLLAASDNGFYEIYSDGVDTYSVTRPTLTISASDSYSSNEIAGALINTVLVDSEDDSSNPTVYMGTTGVGLRVLTSDGDLEVE